MPPAPAELEEWWLIDGYEALVRLVDDNGGQIDPRQCGFAQDIRRKLLAFDNDHTLEAKIREGLSRIRATKTTSSETLPSKCLADLCRDIFRRPEDGGINHDRVMDGLGYLDAMEVHRLRLVEAAQEANQNEPREDHRHQLLEELHRAASAHYRPMHASFRTYVRRRVKLWSCASSNYLCRFSLRNSLKISAKERTNSTSWPESMPSSPPVVLLEDIDDVDPTPHSPGLRDSIRFSIFEHLMSENPLSPQQQQVIKMKLLGWCGIPEYPKVREALVRYSEECKKLGDICSTILSARQLKSANNILENGFPINSSCADTSLTINSPLGLPAVPNPTLNDASIPRLLLTSATTNETDEDISYPHDLSRPEYFLHPLMRDSDRWLRSGTLDSLRPEGPSIGDL
ncbi:hypothetical protein NM208_g14094 [Fusarium decemcellulare]|uniref:Uncharacterized protein n=1 Tax=Fusarium decemcellulare TaxID=57161 RepID=A0ACC1RIK2_9HYPO|nr:hypothetical protein NM208_g14094 [Fusarium decemcellulare]